MTRSPRKGAGDAGGTSRAYVDTHYFLSLIFEDDDASDVKRLFYKLQNGSYRILVPQLVLGEITAKILGKSQSDELPDRLQKYHSLFSVYHIDHSCLPGVDRRVSQHMSNLENIDDWLDPNDTLILSQVLADPNSKFFFTVDTKILYNPKILDYEYELRKDGDRTTKLKITESLD
ncbi:MAG: PIN domain-containing protein [Thaumarchaeota archaeon]|nr:PIN domain-containing protein [Nitrososphaerota archaeon]MDE0525968.1 PIN domain-containing protein [Nitrososphaerota archaeon]